jgi:DNA polymerase-3 subunit alpha
MQPVFWGAPGRKKSDVDGEGGDVSGGGAYLHMTMLAENDEGLRNLFRLSTEASVSGYYRKGRMDAELIAKHACGIIATTGCPGGEVQTRLRLGQFDEAVEAAGKWQDIFGRDNFFLELMDHGLKIENQVRQGLLEVAKRVGLRPLATNDSHYVKPDDADTHDTLLCVGIGKNKADTDRFRFDGNGYYLKSGAEMRQLWDSQVPGACNNTLIVAERVQSYDEVFAHRDLMPRFPVPKGHTQDSWLREETWRGLHFRYGDTLPAEIVERAEYELGVIEKMDFSAYFLVVADICRHARESGIAVGPGRGSAAGSIVAYATRITELDPMLHGLMFERFLNPERVSPPDADLDFDERRRGDVVRYITEKYGSEHVSQIITFGTIKAKAAIKDATRVLDYPYSLGEKLSKMVPASAQGNEPPLAALEDEDHPRYAEFQPLRDLMQHDEEARAVLAAARGLEGFIRSTGVHPAGVLVSAEPLVNVLPLAMRQNDKAMIAGFVYPLAEAMGLLKIDLLGLRNLTIMSDAVKAIKERLGIEVDMHALPLDDRKTYELMSRGDTLGTFQLDGDGMRSLLRMMKPDKFEDISAAGALYRPGPMGADSHTNYALRKNGKQPVVPIHPELSEPLEEILGETYGLIVYQEQVMAIAQKVAGYSLAQADLLRRAMGKKKKEELDKQFVSFEAGMKANGFGGEAVRTLWDLLVPFSDYAFNKAHSAAYGLLAYWTTYLKAHYPADYMAAVLTSVSDNKDRKAVYLAECRHMGIKVLPPDVNESGLHFTAVGDREIRFGLSAVRNVGAGAAQAVVDGRRVRPYGDLGDFLDQVPPAACTKRVVDSLAKAGGFDSLGHARQGVCAIHESAVEQASKNNKIAATGQSLLFAEETAEVKVPDLEWDKADKLQFEREMLGLYVSDHPLSGLEAVLKRNRDVSLAEVLAEPRDGAKVILCGMLTSVERRVSKANNPWALTTLEDLDASIEVVFFGKTYQLCSEALIKDVVVAVEGKVQIREDDSVTIVADVVSPIEALDVDLPLEIHVDEASLTPEAVERLGQILDEYQGETRVHVYVRCPGKTVICALQRSVNPTLEFRSEIKELLGWDALRR